MGGSNTKPFNAQKCLVHLKTARIRMSQLQNKKSNLIAAERRQIADLLSKQKEEIARIKVEQTIRESFLIEAYELLSNMIEMVVPRMTIISQSSGGTPPSNVEESIQTLVYASGMCEIPELLDFRSDMASKYGTEYIMQCVENRRGFVNQKVLQKLSVSDILKSHSDMALQTLAQEYGIDWQPTGTSYSPTDLGIDDGPLPHVDFPLMAAPPSKETNFDDDLEARFNNLRG
ncbi:hypothetical protein GEMRC1_004070 [Eukaryota sp. GEM-RC1]